MGGRWPPGNSVRHPARAQTSAGDAITLVVARCVEWRFSAVLVLVLVLVLWLAGCQSDAYAYRYVGIPYTHLEECHNKACWTACTEACPKTMAPNLITLLAMFNGFICFALMWYYSPSYVVCRS